MKVCYFGWYNLKDPRNVVLIEGLRKNGVEVIECHDTSPGLRKFFKLFFKHWKIRNSYDAMVVGFLGQLAMPLAVLVNSPLISFRRSKPIVFDAFLSNYDTNVLSRQRVKKGSPKAIYYWLLDWFSMRLGDVLLFDTQEHINYVSKEFGLKNKSRIKRIFVGWREDVFQPKPKTRTDNEFQVIFHGTFIRSQGIEFILQAAKNLESHSDIKFILIGNGQVGEEMFALAKSLELKNVEFPGFIPLTDIADRVAQADLCLGLFGTAGRIQRVIPTKVFECAAMCRPVITADAPAVRELFDDEDVAFVPPGDPAALTAAILSLKADPDLRECMAENSYRKLVANCSTIGAGRQLKELIQSLIGKKRI